MANIKISELAKKADLILTDLLAVSDTGGTLFKGDLQTFSNLFSTVSNVAFKGALTISEATATDLADGFYFPSESGDYVLANSVTKTVALSNNLVILIVGATHTTLDIIVSAISLTVSTTFDETNNVNPATQKASFDKFNPLIEDKAPKLNAILENPTADKITITDGKVESVLDDEEYLSINLDANKNIISSVTKDGDIEFGTMPNQLKDYIQEKIEKGLAQNDKVFGEKLTINKPISKHLDKVSLFSKLTLTPTGNNLAYIQDFAAIAVNGINYSCSNGVFSISGTATSYSASSSITGRFGSKKVDFPRGAGTYTLSVNMSGLTEGAVIFRRVNNLGELIDVALSNFADHTYTLSGTDNFVGFVFVVSQLVPINGSLSVMVNTGSSSLTFEEYNHTELIDFSVNGTPKINIGYESKDITTPTSYGLAVIPIHPTGTTKRTDFTYSNDKFGVYIADSIDVIGADVFYTQRIAQDTFSTGDPEPTVYLSNSVDGLVNGATIYYELDKYITYKIADFPSYILNDGLTIYNDSNGYMTAEYLQQKEIVDLIQVSSIGKVGYNPSPTLGINRNMRSVMNDKNITFCGGYNGTLWRIETINGYHSITHNVVLDSTHLVTGIDVQGDYIFVCDRDPAAGGGVSSATKGNFFVLNKSDLTLAIPLISLQNKGTDCKIYKNHLYIMEQIGNLEVYNVSNPLVPVKVFNVNEGSLGEYQRVQFWENNGVDYMACTGFEIGVTFFNITTPASSVKVGRFELSRLLNKQGLMQIFDNAIDFPYLYCTVARANSETKFTNNVMNGIITIDITDPTRWADVNLINDPDSFTISQIPHSGTPDHGAEADLNPSRMTLLNDFIIANNSSKGTCFFRIIDGIPKYQGSYKITGQDAIPMSMLFTKNDTLIMVNGDGTTSTENGVFFFKTSGVISQNQ